MLTTNRLPHKGFRADWLYEVADAGGAVIATINETKSTFDMGGRAFTMVSKGFLGPERQLKSGDTVLITAKQKPFFNHYTLIHNGRELAFKATTMLATRFGLFENDNEIGHVAAGPVLNRMSGIAADLPAELPPEMQVFLIWLAINTWEQQQSST